MCSSFAMSSFRPHHQPHSFSSRELTINAFPPIENSFPPFNLVLNRLGGIQSSDYSTEFKS
ncbi:hypothetical protein LR48_Vigan231s001100 [Vigna angularis]|uniref:Uncharacterized protein n=1 Tax=Phaseolus angularis TaxID=3914 RepID=A0A0L9T6Y9_PHAAN|nr:hypothetical protein LR48_Vigan231s001100 [Vigna angularis]